MQETIDEMGSVFNHMPGASASNKKMEDYIEAIVDDPEDTRSLLTLMSLILDESSIEEEQGSRKKKGTPKYQKNLGKVDKVLKYQLKEDKIAPQDYGLVNLYLHNLGGTQGTYDYAIMRIHQNIKNCQLLDIGFALMNLHQLDHEEN